MNGGWILAALLGVILAGDGGLVLLHRWWERTVEGRAAEALAHARRRARPVPILVSVGAHPDAPADTPGLPDRCGDPAPRIGSVSIPVGRFC